MSSIAGQKPTLPPMQFYCIAKAGLDHFARNYAAILAPSGVRINNLSPGGTSTPALDRFGGSPEIAEKVFSNNYFSNHATVF